VKECPTLVEKEKKRKAGEEDGTSKETTKSTSRGKEATLASQPGSQSGVPPKSGQLDGTAGSSSAKA
jgi:hypothetical protein